MIYEIGPFNGTAVRTIWQSKLFKDQCYVSQIESWIGLTDNVVEGTVFNYLNLLIVPQYFTIRMAIERAFTISTKTHKLLLGESVYTDQLNENTKII